MEAAQSSNAWDPKCKLFIRLPKSKFLERDPDELKDAFSEMLPEEAMFAEFRPAMSKGYCFLIFESRLAAALAHDVLCQQELFDHKIRPYFGFSKEEQVAVNAGVKDDEIERNHRTLVVKDIPINSTEPQLSEFFFRYGPVQSVKLITPRGKGRSKLMAFIVFKKYHPAQLATEQAHGAEFNGSKLDVSISENKNMLSRLEKFQQAPFGGWVDMNGRGGWLGARGRDSYGGRGAFIKGRDRGTDGRAVTAGGWSRWAKAVGWGRGGRSKGYGGKGGWIGGRGGDWAQGGWGRASRGVWGGRGRGGINSRVNGTNRLSDNKRREPY